LVWIKVVTEISELLSCHELLLTSFCCTISQIDYSLLLVTETATNNSKMVSTTFIFDVKLFVSRFCSILEFLPYEYCIKKHLLVVSKSRSKAIAHRGSVSIRYYRIVSITFVLILLMWIRILTKTDDLFQAILGIHWSTAASIAFICRWNWSSEVYRQN